MYLDIRSLEAFCVEQFLLTDNSVTVLIVQVQNRLIIELVISHCDYFNL